MYSVFIVDDEIIVREGIRNKIDWDSSGFSLAGEAADGEIALSMIQDIKPDILITDIKMPFMDGLDLSRFVKKLQPHICIIILSGHDEFEYAQKAISIGIDDYLLKPFTSEELLKSMNKVADKIKKQEKQFSDISQLQLQLESSAILVRQKFLTDVVLGAVSGSDILMRASDLQIDLIARFYMVGICRLLSKSNNAADIIAAKSRLLSLSCNNDETGAIFFSVSPETVVFIVKGSMQNQVQDAAYNLADSVIHEVSKITDCTVLTALGSVADRTAHLSDSYSDAERVIQRYGFIAQNRIVSIDDMDNGENSSLLSPADDPLVDKLKYAAIDEIDMIINQYLSLLNESREPFSVIASYLFVDIIVAISKLVEELGGDIKNVMPDILNHNFVSNAVCNRDTFITEIRRVFVQTLNYRDSRIHGRYGDVIIKAKQFIAENFSNQGICLHSVADAVNFSPNHFSMIFSQECGITFIEYLTSVRIEQAKKLLKNTTMRSADIAYEVGFNDPHYFSFIFKKEAGISPREYRNS